MSGWKEMIDRLTDRRRENSEDSWLVVRRVNSWGIEGPGVVGPLKYITSTCK